MRRSTTARILTLINRLVPKRASAITAHCIPDLEDGTMALLHELVDRGHRPTLLLEGLVDREAVASQLPVGVSTIPKNTLRGRWRFLRSRTVFTTHDVYSPHDPPRNQTIVNIWHGVPVGKVGLGWVGKSPPGATWTTASCNLGRAFRSLEFGFQPDRVKVLGDPRNDRLIAADRTAVRHHVLPDAGRRLLLWMPTYRVHADDGRVDGEAFDGAVPLSDAGLRHLDDWLAENNAELMVVPHRPRANAPSIDGHAHMSVISNEWLAARGVSLYELLSAADVLITDISSVWADFLLTSRPVVFHFPDLEAYQASRGFYLEPIEAWLPGAMTATASELLAALDDALTVDSHAQARDSMRRRLHVHFDGKSAARVVAAAELQKPRAPGRTLPPFLQREPKSNASC